MPPRGGSGSDRFALGFSVARPPKANGLIIDGLNKALGAATEAAPRVWNCVRDTGNTVSASIPLAMVEARDTGRLQPGNLVLTSSFGGGLTWASSLFRF